VRLAAIRAGDRAALARTITAIENEHPEAAAFAAEIARDLGRAHVVGITGAPGAGKSTLLAALLAECTRRGERVAVVAVDPSSPLSGGAVLGDRVRMGEAAAAENVFVRSIASRGHPGGLARTTRAIVDLLDAAGFERVFVETVGAGQSEVAVAALADTCVVVCPPGLGDDVQAIKAGILEIADLLAVSKGDTREAEATRRDLLLMLALRARDDRWSVPVQMTSAARGEGIEALLDAIARHAAAFGHGRRLHKTNARGSDEVTARVAGYAAADPFQRHCDLELVEAGPGHAVVAMSIAPHHLNFNGACHGGALFTLADSAFGLASNAAGVLALGIETHMAFHLAVRLGERVEARAIEVHRGSRLATYRVDLWRGQDRVGSFGGTVYLKK